MKKVFTSVAAVVAVFAASVAAYAFTPAQTEQEVATEISSRVSAGEDLVKIAEAALKDGVKAETFVSAVVTSGRTVGDAVASSVGGGYVSSDVVLAGVQKGGELTALVEIATTATVAKVAADAAAKDAAAKVVADAAAKDAENKAAIENLPPTAAGETTPVVAVIPAVGVPNSVNRSATVTGGSGSGSVSPS